MKRDFLLRYCYFDEYVSPKRVHNGHEFECPCGTLVLRNYLGDYREYREDCTRCKGTGRFYRRLNRREHHVLITANRQDEKLYYRLNQAMKAYGV